VIHAAGRDGVLGHVAAGRIRRPIERWPRLVGEALLTFSVDGSAVAVHRLVMRVVREHAVACGTLAGTSTSGRRLSVS
jgi:hypothetical protein